MTHEEWMSTLAPKVQGTWNLHNALINQDMEFFVCFGSLSGFCGSAGQGNYAAANSFLDAFVRYRRGLGLVASAIDIGLVEDAGFAYEHSPKVLQRAHSASIQTVGESDLLQALELAICQPCHIAAGLGTTRPLSEPGVVSPWGRDARYSLWSKIASSTEEKSTTIDGEVKELFDAIQKNPGLLDDPAMENRIVNVLGREIGSHLTNTDDMDDTEIREMVIESLVMIEIKSWFRRHLKLELSLVDISNASTIGGLAKVTINVLRAKYQAGGPETNGSEARSSKSDDAQHLQDLVLGRDFRPIPGPVPEWHSESEGHILLTGATGFMGAFLLSMLTTLPKLQSVTCLIRAPSHTAAMTRLDKAFEKFNLPKNFQDKVRAVPGDTSQQYLGLDSADFDQLVEKCSAIFHLGAAVNYSQPYASLRDVNVLGTVNVLAFANTRRLKSVHYFSGLAAYGPASFMGGQKSVPENERPVAGSGQLQHHQGYPLAKSVAESICWDVIANGFPLTIYRPGFVLGHSVTGVGNSDDAVHQLMSTCIRLGLYPHPPDQRNFFVPVDFVCSAAMHISLSNENIGQAYNLIHPDPDQNISLSDTFSIVSQLTSPPLRGVPFSEWVGAISGAKAYPLSQIAPILASRETEYAFWLDSKNEGMVAYGTENLHRALANRPDILECKGMSSLLELYFQQWSQ